MKNHLTLSSKILTLLLLFFVCGCVSNGEQKKKPLSSQYKIVEKQVPFSVKKKMENGLRNLNRKKYGVAEKTFRLVAKENPQLVSPLLNLSLVYIKQEKYLEAESVLREALKRNKEIAQAHNLLGVVMRMQGRFLEAESAYMSALEIDESYANAHMNIAILYDIYMLDYEKAKRHYQYYSDLRPEANNQVGAWMMDLQQRSQVSN